MRRKAYQFDVSERVVDFINADTTPGNIGTDDQRGRAAVTILYQQKLIDAETVAKYWTHALIARLLRIINSFFKLGVKQIFEKSFVDGTRKNCVNKSPQIIGCHRPFGCTQT